jgi:hypothetical protein
MGIDDIQNGGALPWVKIEVAGVYKILLKPPFQQRSRRLAHLRQNRRIAVFQANASLGNALSEFAGKG